MATTKKPAPKRGLGRGLGALIPTSTTAGRSPQTAASSAGRTGTTSTSSTSSTTSTKANKASASSAAEAVYAEIPIARIAANPRQPRTVFDPDALAELTHSIKEIGLLQPLVVRASGSRFQLIAGERRLRACKAAGMTTVPVIIRQTADDALLRDALLENLHRADLNPLEEAAAYSQLLADFGCTQDELASRLGRSRPQVTNTIRLLKLPPAVQRRVAAGVLSAGHARALLSLDSASAMDAMAQRIVAEGLSVRAVEELVMLAEPTTTRGRKSKEKKADRHTAEVVAALQRDLADHLETRVHTSGFKDARSRGRVIIDCADLTDLRRIMEILGV